MDEDKIWSVPINTETTVIGDRGMNYKILALISLYSKYKGETVCDLMEYDYSEIENHRYIYQDYIIENKEELEKESKNSIKTIKRNIKKLIECDNKVIQVCKDKKGKVFYKINPYFNPNDKSSMNNFVTIDSDMLRYLVNISNSDVIKVYCIFKWLLWDNKNKTYVSKRVDRYWICRQLGLNEESGKNLQKVTDILQFLVNNFYITRTKENILDKDGKYKTVYYYKIATYDYWKEEIKKK